MPRKGPVSLRALDAVKEDSEEATFDRFKRLMADFEAGRVDVAVIYKISWLTRSLADFSNLVQAQAQEHR